ncbi:MAG: SRPBCC domain-containing protein [Myxococcota bacterium]
MSDLPDTGGREVFEVFIRGTIEDVWHEVTKTDAVQRPMFNMRLDTDLKVGSPLRLRTANGKYTGFVGEVLEVDPPRRFSFTFKFTNYDDPHSRITYELEPADEGVLFRMVSDRMTPDTRSTKAMTSGGHMIVDSLKAVIEHGDVPLKTRALYVLFWLMQPFTPKSLRSENFP